MAYKALFWSFYVSFCTFCASLRLTRTVFSRLLKKGRFNGLVDEGKSLRQNLAFRAEFAENTKPAKKLRALCDLCGQQSV